MDPILMISVLYYLGILLLIFLILLIGVYSFTYIRYQILSPLRFLPGVTSLAHPVYGNLNDYLHKATLSSLSDYDPCEYGHVRRIPEYWGKTRIEVQDPDWINHILVTNASNYIRSDYIALEDLEIYAGDSLLTLDGEDHRRLRKIAAPAFRPSILKSLVGVMDKTAEGLIAKWDKKYHSLQSGGVAKISVRQELSRLSTDILGLCMFGHEFDAINGKSIPANSIYDLTTTHMPTKLGVIPGYKTLLWLLRRLIMSSLPLIGPHKNRMETVRIMIKTIDDSMNDKTPTKSQQNSTLKNQNQNENHNQSPQNCNQSALFDYINNAYLDHKISRSEMVDVFTSFIIAGLDTTSVALTWTLLLLANNPETQAQCREEVEAFNKEKDGRPMTWDDFNGSTAKLPWCKAVLQESMRLFPPVPHIVRKPLVDDTICGCPVPAGTNIVMQIIKLHRSEQVWGPTANTFDPNRFLHPDSQIHSSAYIPFADGRHKCIGNQFAMTHMQISLAKLITNYQFSRLPGETGIPLAKLVVSFAPWEELVLAVKKRL